MSTSVTLSTKERVLIWLCGLVVIPIIIIGIIAIVGWAAHGIGLQPTAPMFSKIFPFADNQDLVFANGVFFLVTGVIELFWFFAMLDKDFMR